MVNLVVRGVHRVVLCVLNGELLDIVGLLVLNSKALHAIRCLRKSLGLREDFEELLIGILSKQPHVEFQGPLYVVQYDPEAVC